MHSVSFSKDIFSVILKFILDGKTAVIYSRVCKKWKEYIYNNTRLKNFIDMHYILTLNYDEFHQALNIDYLDKPLWYKVNIRLQILLFGYKDYDHTTTKHLLEHYNFLDYGEGPTHFENDKCIIITNDYYDEHYSLEKHQRIFLALNNMKKNITTCDFTWKYIKFPHKIYNVNKTKYHRGTSLQLIFKKKEEKGESENKKIKL